MKVKRVLSDTTREYLGMRKDLEDMGIVLTTSTACSTQSNGLAEQMNRMLMYKVKAMLKDVSMP